jgi:hypothetical protein
MVKSPYKKLLFHSWFSNFALIIFLKMFTKRISMRKSLIFLSLLAAHVSLFAAEDFPPAKEQLTAQQKQATFELVWAAKEGNPKKALAALRSGAHVNGDYSINTYGTAQGDTPLTEACRMSASLHGKRKSAHF